MKRMLLLKLFGLLGVFAIMGGGGAWAIAPTIYDLPSPVIGNQSGSASQAHAYVYPDAFDLNKMADDNLNNPPTTTSLLRWSYEIVGTPKYAINGLPPIDSSKDDLLKLPDDKNINKTINTANEPYDADGKPNTVTIRNINLAPFTGAGASAPADVVDKQAVTFYCSNGAAVSSQTILFYTDNNAGGWNRLSKIIPPYPPPYPCKLGFGCGSPGDNIIAWPAMEAVVGSVTTTTWGTTGRGLCFNVPKAGNNMWSVQSKYAFFSLNDNYVYRIRATMNSSQGTVGKTPFWDFIVENYGTQNGVTKGLNLYGADWFYLDNEGGANSIVTTQAGTECTMYWAPIAFQTPQWRSMSSGIYATKYAADKDPYLRFRVMDAVANPGLMSDQKFGQICLQKVLVEPVPFSRIAEDATLYQVAAPRAANNNDKLGNMYAAGLIGTAITYPGNSVLNIQPSQAAWTAELVTVCPAVDLNGQGGGNITPPYTQIADDWPIAWTSDKILKLEVGLAAPDTNSQNHPFDVIWLSMEPPTNEIDAESFVTSNQGIASPKTGTPQIYTFFYYTANETKSAVGALHFLRWRIRFGNNQNLNFPLTSDINNNSGSVQVKSVKVTQVHVQ